LLVGELNSGRVLTVLPRVDFLRRKIQVLSQAQRGQLAADLKTEASTRTIPADEWVLNEISAHVQRFGTGPGEVIVTNRLGRVARRNSFGDRWRLAVADARTCGKPSALAFEGGLCGETCADPAHRLSKGMRFHDLRHFYASTFRCQPEPQGDSGPARSCHYHRDDGYLRAPFPRLGRPRPRGH
jgi:hypothetical protein